MNQAIACDPARSVVVEACAGSGKTWLLTARIVRALLAGTPPGRILALTFTNKAAAEMEARVWLALEELALMTPAQQRERLETYGLAGADLETALGQASGLYESVLLSADRPVIATFHAWYRRLLTMAPREAAHLSSLRPAERLYEQRQRAWLQFMAQASRLPALELALLVREFGLGPLQETLWQLMGHRALAPAVSADGPAWAEALETAQRQRDAWAHAHRAQAQALVPDVALMKNRERLQAALAGLSPETLGDLVSALLVQPRDQRPRQPMNRQLVRIADRSAWGARAEAVEATLVGLAESLNACLEEADLLVQQARDRALRRCGEHLARIWNDQAFATDETDFDGLEAALLGLLESDLGAQLLSRVDARTQQILVDEFQDTSPIQWRLLKLWLGAHAQTQSPDAVAPRLFVVGDPKQAIYRFRGADPLVFRSAVAWLKDHYGAEHLEQDTSRRCHPAIVALVNDALHPHEPDRIRRHEAHEAWPPGHAAALPLVPADTEPEDAGQAAADLGESGRSRDWLREPLGRVKASAWRAEGDQIAQLLLEARQALGLGWASMRLLMRSRTHMVDYERALMAAGIPFVSDRSGGLLREAEVQDLLCLLRLLAHPWSNADLAQVLRSPLVGADNRWLVVLGDEARQTGQTWWQLLQSPSPDCLASLTGLQSLSGQLMTWRSWVAELPVHDLIDRLLQDGLWQRACGYGDPQRTQQVMANWAALLDLSLRWEGGRHPSLSRFVRDMTQLALAPDGEAPAPGALEQQAEAVSIQSLHSAKGLEADLIVLAGFADRPQSDKGLIWLPQWDEERTELQALRAWRKDEAQSLEVAALRAERELLADQERANLLYVAVTRARRYLFVSAVEGQKSGSWYDQLAAHLPVHTPGSLYEIAAQQKPADEPPTAGAGR